MKRKASAVWNGNIKEGKGTLSTSSGAFANLPYSFRTRFEEEPGTNPEELIGTAHAGCFSMALSMILGLNGMAAEKIETDATITIERQGSNYVVTTSHLDVRASVPGASNEEFQKAAEQAKSSCPISKLLNAQITIDAHLV